MRRLLLILLMFVLPLQFTWAVAASYCQHETQATVSHLGHHEHQHDKATDSGATADDGKLTLDNDCHVCHGHGTPALMAVLLLPAHAAVPIMLADGNDRYSDRFVDTPHRPPSLPLA